MRIFAKLVLNMSRQTASKHLYAPTPWHQSSTIVRESYRKMHAWMRANEAMQRQQGRATAATPSATSSSSFVSFNGKRRQQSTTAVAVNAAEPHHPFIDTTNQRRLLQFKTTTQTVKIEDDDEEEDVINRARSANNNNNNNNNNNVAAATAGATMAEEEQVEALDSIDIAHRVLALLASHQVSLPIFAKLVLNLTRQTASPLLSAPKPWRQLTARTREHYCKMHAWLRATEVPQPQQGRATAAPSSATSSSSSASSFVSSNDKRRQQSTTAVAVNAAERRQPFIDTAKLVRKVKEMLRAFDISQDLFARCIVGLNRTTLNQLLAQPKPWSKLLPKARQPYMRMQVFVNEPLDAIKKLMLQRKRNKLVASATLDPNEDEHDDESEHAHINVNNNNDSDNSRIRSKESRLRD